jgi:quercetin dioxygenase-like cupin family protein
MRRNEITSFNLDAEALELRELAAASQTGRAAKTLVKQDSLRITLVAIKKGTKLQPHQVTDPISIQILRGRMGLTTDQGTFEFSTGNLVTLAAGAKHEVKAHDDTAILITFAA